MFSVLCRLKNRKIVHPAVSFVSNKGVESMNSPEEIESIKTLFNHQNSFVISKILFSASELGVFDLLRESGELLPSATIAERLGTSLHGMEMLLGACVALDFLKMEWKDNKGFYGNTDIANLYLGKSSPNSQYYTMKFYSEEIYPSMQFLTDAVRKGSSQIPAMYGISSTNPYDAYYRSKEGVEAIFNFMTENWNLLGREVLSAFDLSDYPLIYDLGGSSGNLAKQLISIYPNCTVTIFDLPEVVKISKGYCVSSDETRITFHEGDFFKDPIPEADLYMLTRVLFNWSDEKCLQLLTKVFKACKPGGGVLIAEPIFHEHNTGPLHVHMFSIIMMVIAEGKGRSLSEHQGLLNKAGFKHIQFKKGNMHDVILAKK